MESSHSLPALPAPVVKTPSWKLRHTTYAGIGNRLIAACIDLMLVMFLGAFLAGVGRILAELSHVAWFEVLGGLAGDALWILYYPLGDGNAHRGTVGKMVLGLRVCDEKGKRISFGRAAWRHVLRTAVLWSAGFGAPLGLSDEVARLIPLALFLVAVFTRRKQGVHDLLSRTVVLSR